MKTLLVVTKFELRMQLRRPAFWLALLALLILVQLETFPSGANLRRLTHLDLSAYVAFRTFLISMPLVAIVAALLSTGRLGMDRRLEMESLLWSTPGLTPLRYGLGKWLSAISACALFPLALGLVAFLVRAVFFPAGLDAADFLKATLLTGLLPLVFAVTLGFGLGALLGERLAGVLLTLYFLVSSATTSAHPVTGEMPFYRFMGDLGSLIFVYPGWPYGDERIAAGWLTAGFEVITSLGLLLLVLGVIFLRRKEVV
jgi:hypothetical protein